MLIPENNQELAPYLDQEEIVANVRDQIDRDFNFFGLEVNWPSEICSAEEMWKSLAGVIDQLMEKDKSRLMQIIYRIDLAESELTQALTDPTVEDVNGRIASMILFRELQKVILRIQYG
jgi:hypothetical protein